MPPDEDCITSDIKHIVTLHVARLRELLAEGAFERGSSETYWSVFIEIIFRLSSLLQAAPNLLGVRYEAKNDLPKFVSQGGKPIQDVTHLISYVRNAQAHSFDHKGLSPRMMVRTDYGSMYWGFAILGTGSCMAMGEIEYTSDYEDDYLICACSAGVYLNRHLRSSFDWTLSCYDKYIDRRSAGLDEVL